jgi:superfamily II DNA or RNA helicase
MEHIAHQQRARRQINALLNQSRHPIYLAPCGTGKTYTAAQIIADRITLNRRVFILVPQVEIFDEWMRVLSEHGLNPGYINDEGIRGKDRGVYICMALSLLNILPMLPECLYPDEIITDEMQHSLAASWEEIYRFFPNAIRIGLTATLYHGSLRSFEHLYTDMVATISKSKAIKEGFITKPLLICPEEYAADVPKNGEDFDTELQAEILGEPKIVGDVLAFYSRTFEGRPVIVPCATYAHAKMMVEAFNDSGWQFEHLHSFLGKHERKRVLRNIAQAKINGICTVGIGIEGMSIHGLYGVLWLRRTASPIIWTQFNGRAERIVDGKNYYICADFVGNSVIHGMPDRDLFWTLEQQNAELPEQRESDAPTMVLCWHCGVMNSGLNIECHFCGAPLECEDDEERDPGRIPAMVDGKLVIVESDGQAREIEQRSENIKLAQQEERIERQQEQLREIPASEKTEILHKNLFAENRRKLFAETLREWQPQYCPPEDSDG